MRAILAHDMRLIEYSGVVMVNGGISSRARDRPRAAGA